MIEREGERVKRETTSDRKRREKELCEEKCMKSLVNYF